jgi:hypothetical protein
MMMKNKPTLIIAGALMLTACVLLFSKCRTISKTNKGDVVVFLALFNADLQKGNTDTLLKYFEGRQKGKQLIKLLGALSNKKDLGGIDSAHFNITLHTENAEVEVLNGELSEANIPVELKGGNSNPKQTTLMIKVRKIGDQKYRIAQIDARSFVKDYVAYADAISEAQGREIVYSPITLAAFKTADSLKTRYDSVVWFAHVDQKTYYYVVKGKWQGPRTRGETAASSVDNDYEMGLVGPNLKEIIPPDYDVIHTINATFPGLVEVEKDGKRGFYDLQGKIVIPVNYDEIFPVNDDSDIGILRRGDDYFYLEQDFAVSNKVDINIADFAHKIKNLNDPSNMFMQALQVVTEYNSKENPGAIYIAPSYLVDLNMIQLMSDFRNPLRKGNYDEIYEDYNVGAPEKDNEKQGWLTASFYSIKEHFLGGRGDFYERRNIILADKKSNRLFAQELATDFTPDGQEVLEGQCDVKGLNQINDTLIEVRSGAVFDVELYDSTQTFVGGPYFHYLTIKNNKLEQLPERRKFNFTKYVKIDDSYINGCYNMLIGTGDYDARKKSTLSQLTPEILRYMKNEIFADYRYQFKDKRWDYVFTEMEADFDSSTSKSKPLNANVDDSLTAIDKYNINWIMNKLKQMPAKQPKALAAE